MMMITSVGIEEYRTPVLPERKTRKGLSTSQTQCMPATTFFFFWAIEINACPEFRYPADPPTHRICPAMRLEPRRRICANLPPGCQSTGRELPRSLNRLHERAKLKLSRPIIVNINQPAPVILSITTLFQGGWSVSARGAQLAQKTSVLAHRAKR